MYLTGQTVQRLQDNEIVELDGVPTNDRNCNAIHGDMIIGTTQICNLYMEYFSQQETFSDSKPNRIFVEVSNDDRNRVNLDLIEGKKLIKDGCRAKSLNHGSCITYVDGLTFWWDNGEFWATFDTDKEAVEWLLKQ